jgi:membrane protein implicated in regulation of membrane protease activity
MLVATLVLSGTLLLATLLAARYAKRPAGAALGWAAAVTVLPALVLAAVFHVVWIQALSLAVGVAVCSATGARPRWIAAASVASVLFAYGMEWRAVRAEERRREALRTQYPFESLEDRLPRSVPPSAAGDAERLAEVEQSLSSWRLSARGQALERLHNDSVSFFARTPGLGVGRMRNLTEPSEWNLRPDERADAPQQQDYFRVATPSPAALQKPSAGALDGLHLKGVIDFVNPQGFGYVKDRKHVAGFQSHGFTKVPEAADEWKVVTVDLVGLLLHDKPVVYVSEKLPRMEELRGAPTRPLDGFEAAALALLQKGADLHTADGPDGLRMVGALRNAQQCAACHDGARGALLGAFSYRLRPTR